MPNVVLLILLCSMASSYAAENDQSIIIFSSSASDQQTGPEPLDFNFLVEQLEDYHFQQVHAGVDRSLQMLSNLIEGCIRNVVKNPQRELFFDYSLPETLFLGVKAYLSPRAAQFIAADEGNTIDLVAFAQRHKLVVGIDKERSYGALIDGELAKLPDVNKYVKEGIESEERMAGMLLANRIDMWLEYQTVMDNYQQQHLPNTRLRNYYVEGAARFIYSHIACKKSANSAALINKINQQLALLYQDDIYYQAHIQFISDKLKNSFNEVFKLFLAEH